MLRYPIRLPGTTRALSWETVKEGGIQTIIIKGSERNVEIPLKPGQKVPTSGIFLGEQLTGQHLELRDAVEIGAGAHAPGSFFLAAENKSVLIDLVEINRSDAEYVENIIKLNGLNDQINMFVGNLFEPIQEKSYELIFSNIAQMPAAPGTEKKIHDHAEDNGWQLLDQIIREASHHLYGKKYLALLVFEFLGITKRTNSGTPSLKERLEACGFKILSTTPFRREIRPQGETHKSLSYIRKIYPDAPYFDESGNLVDPISYLHNNNKVFLDFYFVFARLLA